MRILLNRGAMFEIVTHMLRSMSILLRYFDLITATAEKWFHTSMTLQMAQEHRELYNL